MQISSQHQYRCTKWKIYWNADTEITSSAISLTLMAYMHRMLKSYNNMNNICLMNQKYIL